MSESLRYQIIAAAIKGSAFGGLLLLISMIAGGMIIGANYDATAVEKSTYLLVRIIGGTGGLLFVLGGLILWLHALHVTIDDFRSGWGSSSSLLFVLIGTAFAAYYFYFQDKARLSNGESN